jgi:hypothetical protein
MRTHSGSEYARVFLGRQNDPGLERIVAQVMAAPFPPDRRRTAVTKLAFALTSQAIQLSGLTREALLQFA